MLCHFIFFLVFPLCVFATAVFTLPTGLSVSLADAQFVVVTLFTDWVGVSFVLLVSMISCFISLFSSYYMGSRLLFFYGVMWVFVVSMVAMILVPTLPGLIVGWDLLGVSSFVLVIFFASKTASAAGLVTLFYNRVGDVLLILLILSCWGYPSGVVFWGGAFLLCCLMTKSAHFPLSVWLPAAMMAPTPISALVHSSTLVTAGVYVLVRYAESFLQSVLLLCGLLMVSMLTSLGGAVLASCETDGKKLIAFSTLSQLGFLTMAGVSGSLLVCFFHLVTHAVFKSLLFVYFGVVIHSSDETQESRFLHSESSVSPVKMGLSYMAWVMMGLPFFSGFYSKDGLVEIFFSGGMAWAYTFLALATITFTASYCFRVIGLGGPCSPQPKSVLFLFDTTMWACLSLMSVAAVLAGGTLVSAFIVFFPTGEKMEVLFLLAAGFATAKVMKVLEGQEVAFLGLSFAGSGGPTSLVFLLSASEDTPIEKGWAEEAWAAHLRGASSMVSMGMSKNSTSLVLIFFMLSGFAVFTFL